MAGRNRRTSRDLAVERKLEAWARWCEGGKVAPRAGASMLSKMIENHGLISFDQAGPSTPNDTHETLIESALMTLSVTNLVAVDVLRLEVGAGCQAVAVRYGVKNYDPRAMGQEQRANVLNVSLRTYRRRLAEAKQTVSNLFYKPLGE